MGHTLNRVKYNGIFQNFVCNITFNPSNYIVVGDIAKPLFSSYILGILEVNVSYDLKSFGTRESYLRRNTAVTFPASSSVRNAERVQSFARHLLLRHSFTVTHICPLFHAAETVWDICCSCSVFTTTHVTYCKQHGTESYTPYSQLSIVRYSPKRREMFPCKSQVPLRAVSGTKRDS